MSYVVTGGGRGIGRAIVERLAAHDTVAVLEADPAALAWADDHPAAARIIPVIGDAADVADAERAARAAASAAPLRGWVNNAAIFRDAHLHDSPARVAELINTNLSPALTGCAVALRHFLPALADGDAAGDDAPGADTPSGALRGEALNREALNREGLNRESVGREATSSDDIRGAIINISSHQAQRAVRGALPYATAKAAIEGLTRALAVDYGPFGVRTNALSLGSIATDRSDAHLAALPETGRAHFHREISLLHPLGRMGRPSEVAEAAAFLLSDAASFINGAIIPMDGGRSAQGRDPEEA